MLNEDQRDFLLARLDRTIELQDARVRLEQEQLEHLVQFRNEVLESTVPESVEMVRAGMVTLGMLESVKKGVAL